MKKCEYCKKNPVLGCNCGSKEFYNYKKDFCSPECYMEYMNLAEKIKRGEN